MWFLHPHCQWIGTNRCQSYSISHHMLFISEPLTFYFLINSVEFIPDSMWDSVQWQALMFLRQSWKFALLWNVMQWILVERHQLNVSAFLPDSTGSHCRRWQSCTCLFASSSVTGTFFIWKEQWIASKCRLLFVTSKSAQRSLSITE